VQVDLEGQAHLSKLKDVESTFARFVLADEWLWSPEARGKTHLTEARLPPYLPEQRLRGRLVAGCRAWAHALDHRARLPSIPKQDSVARTTGCPEASKGERDGLSASEGPCRKGDSTRADALSLSRQSRIRHARYR